jgi:hypothetical protein
MRFTILAVAAFGLSACGPMPYYSNYPPDGSNIDRPHPVSGPTIGIGVGPGR